MFRRKRRGAWAVAKFEHDSSRPVEGYAAPQLHTHAVVFNVTETADGNTRALQPQELYKTQQYATAVYRSELAARLQAWATRLSAESTASRRSRDTAASIWRRRVRGGSRSRQQMAAEGRTGAGAAQIAAHQTRDAKQPLSHDEVRERHQAMARVYGNQPQRVLTEAAQRPGVELTPEPSRIAAHGGMSYARERGMEREAVSDERSLMRDALKHTMGEARLPEIKAEFESRVESREFIRGYAPGGACGPCVHHRRDAGLRARADRPDEEQPGQPRRAGGRQRAAADDGAASASELEPAERGRYGADEP